MATSMCGRVSTEPALVGRYRVMWCPALQRRFLMFSSGCRVQLKGRMHYYRLYSCNTKQNFTHNFKHMGSAAFSGDDATTGWHRSARRDHTRTKPRGMACSGSMPVAVTKTSWGRCGSLCGRALATHTGTRWHGRPDPSHRQRGIDMRASRANP